MNSETIAGIATALNNSGISVIRLSGDDALTIVSRIFKTGKGSDIEFKESHTIKYGFIYDGNDVVDEVLVSYMKAPKTYTKEDVIEVNCHGGITVTKKVLELILKSGARLAEAGEFTKRAFLNGRIDLSEAEAVMELIEAKNERAMKNSVKQLKGSVCSSIISIRENILKDVAFIEAALDDPEHISIEGFKDTLSDNVNSELKIVSELIKSSENGRFVKEGIMTVILGKPNVGKSSLLNAFAGEERAIVTDIAGTTRDVIEETININGLTLRLLDTAGIRQTENVVEKIGVDKALEAAENADLILYVVDATESFKKEDEETINSLKDRNLIIIVNKGDLQVKVSLDDIDNKTGRKPVVISAKEKQGINEIEKAVSELFFSGKLDINEDIYITNARHKEALIGTEASLLQVKESIAMDMPEDFYTIDLMKAYSILGEIIGESVDEDLVNKIFSDFCMGK